jgi:hypothetical protein
MTTSAQQITANKINAQHSTGPITENGKNTVATNALKHGLFCQQLILSNENSDDFSALLQNLESSLNPTNVLEQSLVERIAVTLWRQARLVRAETAQLQLNSQPSAIASEVNRTINDGWIPLHTITEGDLTPFNPETLQWCRSIIAEQESLGSNRTIEMSTLKKNAPLTYQQLSEEAAEEQQSIEQYLAEWDDSKQYFTELIQYCKKQIKQAELNPKILEITEQVRTKNTLLCEKDLQRFSKYQVMLDNELYKAIKALRGVQSWWLKTTKSNNTPNGFVLEPD